MEMACPLCKAVLKVPDKHHYKIIKCPKCGKEFQALGKETIQLTREYLEKMKNKEKKKPDS